jgi:hypothetical protein
VRTVPVFNTLSWPRTDLVVLPADWNLPGDRVEDAQGAAIPSQRMTDGRLALLARDVPAFGEARYTVSPGTAHSAGACDCRARAGRHRHHHRQREGLRPRGRASGVSVPCAGRHGADGYAVGGGAARGRPDAGVVQEQRWVDVSNDARGITWATVDAPLIELGAITNDARAVGWIETLAPTTTLYSYVMNNYWETNYKASQEGPTVFRYALRPHGPYDQVAAQRFGIEQNQPLIAVPANNAPAMASTLQVTPDAVIVTSIRPIDNGAARLIRLFNTSEEAAEATVTWAGHAPQKVGMKAYAIKTVRVE